MLFVPQATSRMVSKSLRPKAVIAICIIGALFLLYLLTSGGSDSNNSKSDKKPTLDTSKCETAALTLEDLKQHTKCSLRDYESNDFWISINGYVFDVSHFITSHPGGEAICSASGEASKLFKDNHVSNEILFKELLKPTYCIGKYVHGA